MTETFFLKIAGALFTIFASILVTRSYKKSKFLALNMGLCILILFASSTSLFIDAFKSPPIFYITIFALIQFIVLSISYFKK